MQEDTWSTESRTTLLDRSPWLVVESHGVRSPSGKVISDWTWVVVRNFVNVVALTAEGTFILLRQAKYAVKTKSLATIGGCIEDGEAPIVTAKRELLEEAGYEASNWTSLGQFPIEANRGCGESHFFLATEATKTCEPFELDEPGDEVVLMDGDSVRRSLLNGEFRVLSWVNAVALALLWLDSREPGA